MSWDFMPRAGREEREGARNREVCGKGEFKGIEPAEMTSEFANHLDGLISGKVPEGGEKKVDVNMPRSTTKLRVYIALDDLVEK